MKLPHLIEFDRKRRSFIPGFRTLELVGTLLTELLRYRVCIRARKPDRPQREH